MRRPISTFNGKNINVFQDKKDILNALAFGKLGDGTNTQAALRLLVDDVFLSRNGDRPDEQNKVRHSG